MLSLISIPAYLLKNTLQRWFENPASPITKIAIPYLFAILALLVFGIFQHFKSQIRDQLDRDDLRVIRTQEILFASAAAQRIINGTDESHLWSDYCERYDAFQQAPLLATTSLAKQVPLLSYNANPPFDSIPTTEPGEPRAAVIFTNQPITHTNHFIELFKSRIHATALPYPHSLQASYNAPAIAMVPSEFIEPALERGYTQFQFFLPKQDVSTAKLETLIRAHAYAEGRNITIHSSLEILDKLDELLTHQKTARLIIGFVVTIILSLTLGSLSLLEFRQERYLFALLRSFGVRKFSLFIHYLIETSVLTLGGLFAAVFTCKHLAPLISINTTALQNSQKKLSGISISPQPEDYQILLLAIALGIIISAIPVAQGLRKEPGTFLP